MRKISFCVLASILSCGALAQDLDRTIKISNDYKVGTPDLKKISTAVSVPDSVSHFNYNFDYSVFEAPYKGAFEFHPFLSRMAPVSSIDKSSTFWLKAGAGYVLRPELKAAWDAVNNEKFSLELHQDLNGFVGNYRSVRTGMSEKRPLWTTANQGCFGYDLSENFGASVRFALSKSEIGFSADYRGLFNDDAGKQTNYNSGLVAGRYTLKRDAFDMDVNLSALFAADVISHPYQPMSFSENVFKLDGYVNPFVKAKLRICLDYDFRYMMRSRQYSYNCATAIMTPNVRFDFDWVKIKAGVNLSLVEDFYVRPDVRVVFKLFGGVLNPYVSVTGSAKPNSYSSLKLTNHWYNPGYADGICGSVESLNALLGFRGTITKNFAYDIQGGYLSMISDTVWGVKNDGGTLLPALVFQDYKAGFVKAKLVWKSKSVEADGTLSFIKTDILDRVGANSSLMPWDLPMFTADVRAVYNYRKRIYVGASLEMATDRMTAYTDIEGYAVAAPYYFDLGVFAEYRLNDKLRFWIKGENLLNEAIQRYPLHVESGIGGTLGITLIL